MKTSIRLTYLGLGLATLLTTILYCGISRDPEFYEAAIFIKHRPTFKIHFYKPGGESDITLSEMNAHDQKETLLYKEFVEDQEIYSDNLNRLWFLPPILIQLTLTLFVIACSRQMIGFNRIVLHFLINLFPTTAAVSLMLFYAKHREFLILTILLLIVNAGTIKLVRKKVRQSHPI